MEVIADMKAKAAVLMLLSLLCVTVFAAPITYEWTAQGRSTNGAPLLNGLVSQTGIFTGRLFHGSSAANAVTGTGEIRVPAARKLAEADKRGIGSAGLAGAPDQLASHAELSRPKQRIDVSEPHTFFMVSLGLAIMTLCRARLNKKTVFGLRWHLKNLR